MKAINPSGLWKKKLGDWAVNPYLGCEHGCFHCYVPTMPGSAMFQGPVIDENGVYYQKPPARTQRDWGNYIFEKAGYIDALRDQLRSFTPEVARIQSIANRRVAGEDLPPGSDWFDPGWILVSFLTDCYTPMEGKRRLTRDVIKLLLEAGHKVRIQTRSAMVERDFDILKEHGDRVLLGTSLPYLDDDIARVLEPHSTSPTRRLQMLSKAIQAGIPCYVAIAPAMPFNDLNTNQPLYQRVFELLAGRVTTQTPDDNPGSLKEIFCEVLNPKGENIEMMKGALNNAWAADDGILAKKSAAAYLALNKYDEARWAEFTATVLDQGARYFMPGNCRFPKSAIANPQSAIPKFIPWPDTARRWSKHLHERDVAFLDQFLPPTI